MAFADCSEWYDMVVYREWFLTFLLIKHVGCTFLKFMKVYFFWVYPKILFGATQLTVVNKVKFLGVFFDKKLTLLHHILHLCRKCKCEG